MKVPFMDLHRQYKTIKAEVDQAIQNVIDKTQFVGGEDKNKFEAEFAEACGAKQCVAVGNGTDAISITLKAMGLGQGDKVIVPANSFVASSEAVTAIGAKPVFVDVDPKSYLIDLKKTKELLEKDKSIKVILPVHLYGRICPMDEIMALAEKYSVKVVEDSAQAHLAEWKGKKAGSWGHAATFSFYPGKNLGAFGDAGAITTNNEDLAALIKKLANHGRTSKYDHDMEGYNSRMDGIQAAVLRVKLRHLQSWTEKRIELARRYNELLSDLENQIELPYVPEGQEGVFHVYVIRTEKREELKTKLEKLNVQCNVHYPIAIPNLKAYEYLGHSPQDFPVSTECAAQVMSLPLFPEMTTEEQNYVVKCLRQSL